MSSRRVVITGVGAISALALDAKGFWSALLEARSRFGEITGIESEGLSFRYGAQAVDYVPEAVFEASELRDMDRFSQFMVIASREAVRDAGIEWTPELRRRSAVVTGSAIGGKPTEDQGFRDLYEKKARRLSPLTVPRIMANAGTCHVSLDFGIQGPGLTLSTACSSSTHAIGLAYWFVRNGVADLAITGGSEAPFAHGHLKAWEKLRVISTTTCRPFSKDRNGMILGEGGAALILETLEGARARGARPYAEIVGFGMSSDAEHLTQPSREGTCLAITAALRDADLRPEEVDYVNAHGTGTIANDACEVASIREVFGRHADRLAVSSTKSMHGHAIGAAGALEAVATVLALREGIIPPTANYRVPDPECDLDVVPNEARQADIGCALSHSFAFGGLNGVLAFRRTQARGAG